MAALSFGDESVRRLRADLALALRAADYHGLSEGVCNHFSLALPDSTDRFLINPRGLHWSEIGEDDILMAQVGVRYYLTPNYYVRGSVVQSTYSSNVPNSDYDRTIVYLTLGAQY